MPRITVFTSCYNQGGFLAESMDSVLRQTYGDFEYLVYDDGSTDSTWDTIEEFARRDSRVRGIRLEKQPNVGAVINRSIRDATGEFWSWCPADDLWNPRLLEVKLEHSERHGHKAILYNNWTQIDDSGRRLGGPVRLPPRTVEQFHKEVWTNGGIIGFTGIWIPMHVFDTVGVFPEHLNCSEDYYWMVKASIHGVPFLNVPFRLHKKRIHSNRLTAKHQDGWDERVESILDELRRYRDNLDEEVMA